MKFEVSELPEPPTPKLKGKRSRRLAWGVFEDGKLEAAFFNYHRADAYARRLNKLVTR